MRPDMQAATGSRCAVVRVLESEWHEFNEGYEYVDLIKGKKAAGIAVLKYYVTNHAASGNEQTWQNRIATGLVTLNGNVCGPDAILRPADQLVYKRQPWQEPPAPCSLPVLFEDEHIVVVNKPAGLQVLPGGLFHQRTALTLLEQHNDSSRVARWPHTQVPSPVHRLGRGTSGVLVCACTPVARAQLSMAFAAATAELEPVPIPAGEGAGRECKKLGKLYRALVQGHVTPEHGCIEAAIGKVAYPGVAGGLHAATPDGKPAKSHWKLREHRPDGSSLLEVTIVSGRPHQIRIHMAYMGHPLVGDPLYVSGGRPADASATVVHTPSKGAAGDAAVVLPGDCGYWLHSLELGFTHPASGAVVTVRAPPPEPLMSAEEQHAALLGVTGLVG